MPLQAPVDPAGSPSRTLWHLDNWRRWMRSGSPVNGHPARSLVLSNGGASASFDDMAECEDRRCAKITDALISNLPPPQRLALHVHARLATMPRTLTAALYQQALDAALIALGRQLAIRGVW